MIVKTRSFLSYVNRIGGHSVLSYFSLGIDMGEPALGLRVRDQVIVFLDEFSVNAVNCSSCLERSQVVGTTE